MLEKEDFQQILDNIAYKDWTLKLGQKSDTYYLQVIFYAPDNYTGVIEPQYCRKWQLSQYMTVSEVVRTAYKAIITAEEHEVGEHFRYKNELIYCPHVDVEEMVAIARKIDVRD